MSQRFFCLPLACDQAVTSCVARHAAATRPYARNGGQPRAVLASPQCVGCRVGEGHAAGRMVKAWSPGVLVERVGKFTSAKRAKGSK